MPHLWLIFLFSFLDLLLRAAFGFEQAARVAAFADAGRNIELNNPQASTTTFGVTTSSYVAFTGVVSADGTVSWTLSPDTTDAGKGLVPLVGFQLLVTGEDIAPAAVFFASADAAWLTGETLYISGGLR